MNSKMYVDVMLATVLNRIKLYSIYLTNSHYYSPNQSALWYLTYQVDLMFYFRVWNYRKYKVASTLFFQVLDHIFSACNLQFKREKTMPPLLFLKNKKKSWPYFFQPVFCTPYFVPYFSGSQFDPSRIVGADWLGNYLFRSYNYVDCKWIKRLKCAEKMRSLVLVLQ